MTSVCEGKVFRWGLSEGNSSRVMLVTWPHIPAEQPQDSKARRIFPTGQFPLLSLEDEGRLQLAVWQHIPQALAG